MRKKSIAVLAALSLGAVAPAAAGEAVASPVAVASKSCSSGFTHASLPWGHKCLRRGQFCKRGRDRAYHRYGFHCHGSGRLT
jgi:hypothetical protein